MKLLVPVEGSRASCNAAKKAADIAKKYGFSIKLITVIDDASRRSRSERHWRQFDGSIISGTRSMKNQVIIDEIRRSASLLLDSYTDGIDFGTINIEKEVLIGEPYEKILETAEKEKTDLIVMGNRGFSKIKRFFIGSVAQKVISEAPCPVLVIHSEAETD